MSHQQLLKPIPKALILLLIIAASSCSDPDDVNTENIVLLTQQVQDITFATATASGYFENPDLVPFEEYGLCWSTNSEPEITDLKNTAQGSAFNEYFFTFLCDLEPNTKYHYRSYLIIDNSKVLYGEVKEFTSDPLVHTCNPVNNSFWGVEYTIELDWDGGPNDEFEFNGTALSSDIYVDFYNEPKTGIYYTSGSVLSPEEGDVSVTLSQGSWFVAFPNQELEVMNFGNGHYELTFCNFDFGNPQGTELNFDGNITY